MSSSSPASSPDIVSAVTSDAAETLARMTNLASPDAGRTNHIHVVVHENATQLENGTLTGGSVPHIGQLFWDQDLIDLVEATVPYVNNTNPITTNAEDHVFGEQETEDSTSDPVFNYVYFNGEDLTDGLFTWIQIGINASASYSKSCCPVTWATWIMITDRSLLSSLQLPHTRSSLRRVAALLCRWLWRIVDGGF